MQPTSTGGWSKLSIFVSAAGHRAQGHCVTCRPHSAVHCQRGRHLPHVRHTVRQPTRPTAGGGTAAVRLHFCTAVLLCSIIAWPNQWDHLLRRLCRHGTPHRNLLSLISHGLLHAKFSFLTVTNGPHCFGSSPCNLAADDRLLPHVHQRGARGVDYFSVVEPCDFTCIHTTGVAPQLPLPPPFARFTQFTPSPPPGPTCCSAAPRAQHACTTCAAWAAVAGQVAVAGRAAVAAVQVAVRVHTRWSLGTCRNTCERLRKRSRL